MNGIARKSKRAFIELADYAANLPTSTFDLCIIHRATVNFGVSLTGNAAYKISFGTEFQPCHATILNGASIAFTGDRAHISITRARGYNGSIFKFNLFQCATLRDPEEPDMVGSAIDGHTGNAVAAAIKAALECGVLCTDRRPLLPSKSIFPVNLTIFPAKVSPPLTNLARPASSAAVSISKFFSPESYQLVSASFNQLSASASAVGSA